jgi:predicted DNA-binding protein
MARPPIGPLAMDHTVKFRLRADEKARLDALCKKYGVTPSVLLRDLIYEEYRRDVDPNG